MKNYRKNISNDFVFFEVLTLLMKSLVSIIRWTSIKKLFHCKKKDCMKGPESAFNRLTQHFIKFIKMYNLKKIVQ